MTIDKETYMNDYNKIKNINDTKPATTCVSILLPAQATHKLLLRDDGKKLKSIFF